MATSEFVLTTDRHVYDLLVRPDGWQEVTIVFDYENRSNQDVYVPSCQAPYPPDIEKLVDGKWLLTWDTPENQCISDPLIIEPGQVYTDTLRVVAAPPESDRPERFLQVPVGGTYRLVWTRVVWNYVGRPPWGDELPLSLRASNPFELKSP